MSDAEWVESFCKANGYVDGVVLSQDNYAAVAPYVFTTAIIIGEIGDESGISDRWCYHSPYAAQRALARWVVDGGEEPTGWHRNLRSGRRVAETGGEVDGKGNVVKKGDVYVRW